MLSCVYRALLFVKGFGSLSTEELGNVLYTGQAGLSVSTTLCCPGCQHISLKACARHSFFAAAQVSQGRSRHVHVPPCPLMVRRIVSSCMDPSQHRACIEGVAQSSTEGVGQS